jgi:hypothetical protein
MSAEVITKLRDDFEYYSGVGKQYISNSDIGSLLSNPKAFGVSRDDNKSFAEGRYFHQLLLEPEKAVHVPYVDASSRLTNKYKEYLAENYLQVALLKSEKEHIEMLVDTIKGNITFYDELYRPTNVFEEPMVGEIMGIPFKGKADILRTDSLIDIKTTSDIQKFRYSAKAYNYDSQCYIYQQLFGRPLIFYVVDKVTAQLGVYTPSEEFIRGGEDKVRRAIQVWERFFGPNKTEDVENFYINETL